MHDDLLGEFEGCPTAKDMWDRLKIRFGQTSSTWLRTLRLKWMQFQLDAGRPMTEQLRTLSGIVRDLKAAGEDIPKDEQALNVIRALPKTKLWENFSQVMAHNDNIKTFELFQSTSKWKMSDKKKIVYPSICGISRQRK